MSLSLETSLGPSRNSVTHDSEEITLVSSIFSYSLIKGLSKVRSGKYKHSCCPPSPVFWPVTNLHRSLFRILQNHSLPTQHFFLPKQGEASPFFSRNTAAMEIVMRHESSWIQQLSSSDNSMKLKLNCLLASGCSSNLPGAVPWLEIWGPGHKVSPRGPLCSWLVTESAASQAGLRGHLCSCQRDKSCRQGLCLLPWSSLLSGVTRRVRPQQTEPQRF